VDPPLPALTLREAASILDEAMRNKGYRSVPLGQDVGRFLRYMRSAKDASPRTIEDYESVLARFATEHAHLQLENFGGVAGAEYVLDFVARHWEHKAPGTRRKAFAILASFFDWAVRFERVSANPVRRIDRPRKRGVERSAHRPERIRRIIEAQPELRDRVAIALMARLALRKNELRLLQWRAIDLVARELRLRAKGGKLPIVPIVYGDLLQDLAQLELEQKALPEHYLLHPIRTSNLPMGQRLFPFPDRPTQPSTMHRWWVRCLDQAAAAHFPMHELRHSAITEFLRANGGDLALAQRFARHATIATTVDVYGHLETEDLVRGMRRAGERWKVSSEITSGYE
jgi:integrase